MMQYPLAIPQIASLSATLQPIAQPCDLYHFPTVIHMNHYGAILPEDFRRTIIPTVGQTDTYADTSVPSDPSFAAVAKASFLVWDMDRAIDILGPHPGVEFMFPLDNVPHEGPAYEPELNLLFFSRLRPEPAGQYVVDLDKEPPIMELRVSDPPLVVPCGSTYHGGLLYWCGSATRNGAYIPGVYAMNATTGKVHPVVNNYFGYTFGTCNDLAVAPNGDIWFTDDWYMKVIPGVNINRTTQLGTGIFRHQISTGLTQLISDHFDQPNGIAFGADNKTVYITDTGADAVSAEDTKLEYKSWKARTVYAADLLPSGTGIANVRAIFLSQDRVPDGIRVARNGYVVAATGHGVDVLDEHGAHILRVQTNHTVLNIAWVGKQNYTELWMVGYQGLSRVRWALEGKRLI